MICLSLNKLKRNEWALDKPIKIFGEYNKKIKLGS